MPRKVVSNVECSIVMCIRPLSAKGMCSAHYRQINTRGWIGPIRGTDEYYDSWFVDGLRKCTRCDRDLPAEEFHKRTDGAAKNQWRAYCRKCNIVRRMSISAKDYYLLLEQQGGGCAICGLTEQGNGRELSVDHDHSCCASGSSCGKCIRGILCDSCNVAISRLRDSPELFIKAANYLKRACPVR